MPTDARINLSGLIEERPSAEEIVEKVAGGSNVIGQPKVSMPDVENAPIFPEPEPVQFQPEYNRQQSFQRNGSLDARRPVENQDTRPRGIDEAKLPVDERMRRREESRQRIEDQTEESRRPLSIRDSVRQPQQSYNTVDVKIPEYDNSNSLMSEASFVVNGDAGQRRHTEKEALDIINDRLNSFSYSPMEAQAAENDRRRTDQDVQASEQAAIDETGIDQIAETVERASNQEDDTVSSAPVIRQFEPYDMPTVNFQKTQAAEKEKAARAIANKSWDGNAFTEKAVPDMSKNPISPGDVSIGSFVIEELVREPGNNLISIVNAVAGTSFSVEMVLTTEGMQAFADTINANNIDVVSTKSPVVGPADVVARRLRIHWGRGIKVHPTQTKAWNLDFDGDGVSISFDIHDGVKNAVNYLIGADEKVKIDIPFFPISQLSSDIDEFVDIFKMLFLQNVQENLDNIGNEAVRRAIESGINSYARSVYYLSNASQLVGPNESLDDFLEDAWKDVLHEMRSLSNNFSNQDIALSGILADLFFVMRTMRQYDIADMVDSPLGQLDEFDSQERPADQWIRVVVGTMAAGNLPPNFQDFITGLHNYIGEIPNKNTQFRIGAKYAKLIKASQEVFVGDEESYRLLYKLTLEAGEAMFMSGRSTIGERVVYMQRIAKDKIVAEVGFPRNYPSIKEFLKAFKTAYNKQMRLIECSDFGGFSCDLDPNPDPDKRSYAIRSDNLADLVKPIISVYGDFTVDYMFPSLMFADILSNGAHSSWERGILTILEGYRYMTLRELSNNNRIAIPGHATVTRMKKQDGESKKKKVTESVPFYEMKISDTSSPEYLLLAIAGKRSAAASKYNKDTLMPLLGNFVKCFREVKARNESRFDNLADYMASMHEMMSALHLSGQRMFDYFGMSNPHDFYNQSWGLLIREAIEASDKPHYSSNKFKVKRGKTNKDDYAADLVGGVRASAVFNFKLRKIDALESAIKEEIESADPTTIGPVDPRRLADLMNQQESAFDMLASVSDLWAVLVGEMRDGNNHAFQSLVAYKGEMDGVYVDAKDFWSDDKMNGEYNSLTEVMADPYMPKSMKEKIAVDVVRVATGFNGFKAYEMNYQLELEADAAYTTMNLMAYNEQPSVITEMHEANRKVSRYFQFKNKLEKVREDVELAERRANPGDLDVYFEDLAANPDLYLEIPADMFVDALESQMDKTFRASEKAGQEEQVNGLFNAIELQRGGLVDTVYRIEARTIGKIDESLLTAFDYIRVLADPTLEITVYNGDYEWTLSRSVLCGDNSEKALWNMLKENPRIACLFRAGVVSSGDKGTTVYRSAKASFHDSMFEVPRDGAVMIGGKIKSNFVNRPMFGAMVSMFVPIHNRSSRSVRPLHRKMFDAMQALIVDQAYVLASNNYENNGDVKDVNVALLLEEKLGITTESLISQGGMEPRAAARWYQTLSFFLHKYIVEVSEILMSEKFSSKDEMRRCVDTILSRYDSDIVPEFDEQSVALAIDCRQTLTGAKTKTSTGVEGNITKNNLGTALYASMEHGRHEIIDGSMSPGELAPFVGCLTSAGVFDGTNIDELEESMNGEPLIVEAYEGYQKQDATLAEDQYQITTLGRFISVNRGEAAEGGNLKAKRSGDDGKDAIAKFTRYDAQARENISKVERIYDETVNDGEHNNKLFAAKLKLAKILMAVNDAEGYDDMDLSDWMDIADVMIKEVPTVRTEIQPTRVDVVEDEDVLGENKTIVVRSIGEISSAIRRQLDQSVVENGSPAEIAQAAKQIADEVGIAGPVSDDVAKNRALVAASSLRSDPGIRKFRPMAKPSEGTFERNYGMITALSTHRMERLPWSNKQINTKKIVGGENGRVFPFSQAELEYKASELFDKGIDGWVKPKKIQKPNSNLFYLPINVTRSEGSKKRSVTTNISPGPQSVWIIESGAKKEEIRKAVEACYSFGMTLAFRDVDALGDYRDIMISDVTEAPFGDGYFMIPFFNIRQSGGAIMPPMAPASFDIHDSNYTVIWEDPYNFYALPDAYILMDSKTANSINAGVSKTYPIKIQDLFWNVLHDTTVDPVSGKRVCDMVRDIRLATWDEIKSDIVDLGPYVMSDSGPSFDLGIAYSNDYFDDRVKKLDLQLKEYINAFDTADSNGVLSEGKPDRIVAFMRCVVGNEHDSRPIYAPVIPWPTGTSLTAPVRFSIKGLTLKDGNPQNGLFLDWALEEPLSGHLVKLHDETNPAGKSETIISNGQNLGNLANGRTCNFIIPTESQSGRKLGTETRLNSMVSLARAAKLDYSFNFADLQEAFPDDPDVKSDLATGYIRMERWVEIKARMDKDKSRYHCDPEIDAYVRSIVDMCVETGTTCPTDMLACRWGDRKINRYVDFPFFFKPTDEFENGMLKFYNAMIPNLCPPSIDSYGDGVDPKTGQPYFFRPVDNVDDEFGYGCLLTLSPPLPHPDRNGKTIRVWGNGLYTLSFFNDESTMLHKPGLNGSHATMEQIAAISMTGKRVVGKHMKQLARYATAPAQKTYGWYDMHLDRGAFLRKAR